MAFFANALNVDVRNSQFNQIGGSQVNYYGAPPLFSRGLEVHAHPLLFWLNMNHR